MMKIHGESNAEIAKEGCGALGSLALNNDANQKSIGEKGGIEIIIRMMKIHGGSNVKIAEYGCRALGSLAANNGTNTRKILAANGLSLVKRMKLMWASNADVKQDADRALGHLRSNLR